MHPFVSRVVALLMLVLLGEPAGLTAAETNPSATEILASISRHALQPGFEVRGTIHQGPVYSKIRVSRGLAGGKLVMRLGRSDRPKIYEWTQEGLTISDPDSQNKIPIKDETEESAVLGLPLNFQEASLGFLKWPNPLLLNSGMIRDRPCWMIQCNNPNPNAADCKAMIVWVDKEQTHLVQVEGYDYHSEEGKPIFTLLKRMRITHNRIENEEAGTLFPTHLFVQKFDPMTGEEKGMWFVELEKPTKIPPPKPTSPPAQPPVIEPKESLAWPWLVAAGLGLAGIVALKFRLLRRSGLPGEIFPSKNPLEPDGSQK